MEPFFAERPTAEHHCSKRAALVNCEEPLINELPLEIFMKILSFLDTDLLSVGRVCKHWSSAAFQELLDRGMYDMEVLQDNFAAISEFTRAICINPSSPSAHYRRGVALYKESEEVEAIRDIQKALSLSPPNVDGHIMKAMLFQIQLNFEQAVAEASRAILMDPLNGTAYYLRGYNKFDLQDYDGSIADLSHCLSLPYPYKSKVLNCRGWCYKIRGDTQRALADFTASSRSNIRYTKPFVNKAIVLSACKDKPAQLEEEKFLTQFLNTPSERNLGSIYYTRAALRQQWDNYEGAIEDYKQSIAFNYHSRHKAHVSVGWCYEKLNQYDKAIQEYNTAIQTKPTYSIAIEHRAGAKCRTDTKAAEEDCRLAIKVNPKNLSFAYRYLAAVQADNNDYLSAIKTLSEGIKVNPLDTDMLLNRAGYYTCQGDFMPAIRDYNTCLKHRPDTYEAWKYRGNVKFGLGDLVGALLDYTNALRIEPDDFTVLNNCGICALALLNFEKSTECLNKATKLPDIPTVPENNLRLVSYIQSKGQLPKQFEPHILTDPVFEKDLEKKIKEATKSSLLISLKPPQEEILSLKQRVLLWKRRNT